MERAFDVTVAMAQAGLDRRTKPMDVIIAAAADSAGLTVLNYDRDLDHISSVTHQTTGWVAPAGSLN